MGFRLAAVVVVSAHLAFVVFVLVGGFVAWRRPGVLRYHVPAVVISAFLAAASLDCPLTDVEKWLLRRAGETPYDGGFIQHYLVEPVLSGGITPGLHLTLRIVTISLVSAAYLGLLAHRRQAPTR